MTVPSLPVLAFAFFAGISPGVLVASPATEQKEPQPPEPVQLSYHFQPGEVLHYLVTVQQRSENRPGSSRTTGVQTTDLSAQTSFRVIIPSAGPATLVEVSFDTFESKGTLDGLEIAQFGSDNMLKVHFRLRAGTLALLAEPELHEPTKVDASSWAGTVPMLESMRSVLAHGLPVLAGTALLPGQTWSVDSVLLASLPGLPPLKLNAKSVFTLIELKPQGSDQVATIEEQLEVSFLRNYIVPEPTVIGKLSGTGKVVYLFAVKAGRLLSSKADLSLVVDVPGDQNQDLDGNQFKIHESWKITLR